MVVQNMHSIKENSGCKSERKSFHGMQKENMPAEHQQSTIFFCKNHFNKQPQAEI